MAVAKSGKGGNEQGKSTGKMSGKKPSSLGGVSEAGLADQGQDKIVDVCQHSCAMTNGEAGRIFLESNIASVMGARLNSPVRAADLQELLRTDFLACEAGNPIFDFAGDLVTDSPSPPLKLAF